jgi:hypothetical protein
MSRDGLTLVGFLIAIGSGLLLWVVVVAGSLLLVRYCP